MLTEELSARDRGWGIGLLGALGSLGHGLAAIAFSMVEVHLPFGWRSLYLLGVVPLLFLSLLPSQPSRNETLRSTPRESRIDSERRADSIRPSPDPHTSFGCTPAGSHVLSLAAFFPFDFAISTAYSFMPKTLQEVHGFAPLAA